MAKAEPKESARTTVILAVVALGIGVYVLMFGLQTIFFFQAKWWARGAPFLRDVPQGLPSTAASPVQTKDLSFYQVNFAAPWKGVAEQKAGDAQSEVDFSAGPVIIFFNPQSEKDILGGVRGGDPETYHRYQAIFGEDIFPTNYDLYNAVYEASPASLSPFMARERVVQIGTLLQWKMAFWLSEASAIYSVQSGEFHGFQLGDPSRDPIVVVRLFDAHHGQLRLLFTSKAGPGTFPQADINCVVDSLQPASRPE